jgi:hypothetical protein
MAASTVVRQGIMPITAPIAVLRLLRHRGTMVREPDSLLKLKATRAREIMLVQR